MKNYKKYFCIVLFYLYGYVSFAGDSIIHISSQKIVIDNIGNIYAFNNPVITKYFTNKQIKTFSIKTYGDLDFIDASNALRLLLYFKDFQRILFLDSQLSQNGDVIELTDLGLEQTSLVCSSFNNGFWVYNQANNELIRFNQDLQISVKSGNIKRILNIDITPNYMIENNGKLYLNAPGTGILVFDIYGAYIKTIPLKNLHQFTVFQPYIFYIYNNTFCSYNIENFETIEITQLPENCLAILFNGDKCYWQYNQFIKINNCIQ